MEERERDEYEVLRAAIDDLQEGFVTTDGSGLVNEANGAACELFGRKSSELAGTPIFAYLEDEYGVSLADLIGRDIAQKKAVPKRRVFVKRPDGSLRACSLYVRPLLGKNGEIRRVYGILNDLTELELRSQIDDKTGLLNHRTFLERVQEQVRMARRKDEPHALVYIDLREFKKLNDTYGHPEGDRVIKMMGHRLDSRLFQTDFKARSNSAGDEFMVLLTRVEKDHLQKVAEKVLEVVTFEMGLVNPDSDRAATVTISADIGICWRRGADIPDAEAFIATANKVMRTCKRNVKEGKPCTYLIDLEDR